MQRERERERERDRGNRREIEGPRVSANPRVDDAATRANAERGTRSTFDFV